ncbi:MAG: ferredoxin [Synergistaceae bacterium]|nr:ferredoxin [Synergistaceae bacterium]
MTVNISLDDCVGCGVCMQVCPDVFSLDEDAGKAMLLDMGKADGEEDLVKEAIDTCPIGCIT